MPSLSSFLLSVWGSGIPGFCDSEGTGFSGLECRGLEVFMVLGFKGFEAFGFWGVQTYRASMFKAFRRALEEKRFAFLIGARNGQLALPPLVS